MHSFKNLLSLRLVILTMLFGLISTNAFAGFIVYTDRAIFLADAATAGLTLTNEDFSGSDPGGYDPFTIDDGNSKTVTMDIKSGDWTSSGNDRISDFDATIVSMSSSALTGSVAGIGFDMQSDDAAILSINGGATSTSR